MPPMPRSLTFALDAAGQRLEPLATSAVGRGCSTFVVDEDRDLVYAATKGTRTATARASTLPPRPHDRRPHPARTRRRDRLPLPGTRARGRVLAGAAYHSGEATTRVLDGEGGISDPVAEVAWRNAHAVATRAAHLYVVSLGEDLLAQYLLGDDGRLTPLDLPTVPALPGSGPRHLVIDEAGTHVYVVTEFSGEVLTTPGHGDRDPRGGWRDRRPRDRPGLAAQPFRRGSHGRAPHLGADIALARGGVWSWRANGASTWRRCGSPTTASPAPCSTLPTPEPQPRGFAVTTDGRYAVVAGERATTVELVAVGADGRLRSLARAHTGDGAKLGAHHCASRLTRRRDARAREADPTAYPWGVRIDVWSDFLCPFCHLRRRQLALALEEFEHADDVEVIGTASSSTPTPRPSARAATSNGSRTSTASPLEQMEEQHRSMAEQAAAVGPDFQWDKIVPGNSYAAHRLHHYARPSGARPSSWTA